MMVMTIERRVSMFRLILSRMKEYLAYRQERKNLLYRLAKLK